MSEKSIEKQDTTNSWVIGEDGHKLTISRGYSIVNAPTMNGLSINATGKGHIVSGTVAQIQILSFFVKFTGENCAMVMM